MKTLWENYAEVADEALTGEKRFAAAAQAGRNCFLTGMAGTGKSTMLRQFIRDSIKRVDVTAPTGVAALNVAGMTGTAAGANKRGVLRNSAVRSAQVHPRWFQASATLRGPGDR